MARRRRAGCRCWSVVRTHSGLAWDARQARRIMWDVVVAGAGPAGALAATILARSGARVLVVDRARFPRDKLCGDSLNPGTVNLLRRLNLASWIETHGLPIEGMRLSGPAGAHAEGRYPRGLLGRSAMRRDFDQWLISEAVGSGAEFDQGVVVRR